MPRLADADFCIRVQLAGTQPHFVPEAMMAYRHRIGGKALFRQGRLWARENASLYKRYRPAGARIPFAWSDYVYDWLNVVALLPLSVRPGPRAQLIYKVGWQIGLLQGSQAYGVEPPVVPRPTLFRRVRRLVSAARRKVRRQRTAEP
jgi:GT2 family glycosyltransferase